MKIAIIGTRGVPARYGGFETCAEELGKRLAARGNEITVYCRSGYYEDKPDTYLGMKLIYLPCIQMKFLDTLSHSIISAVHALRCSYDVLMVFNAANSSAMLLLSLLRAKIVINPDGLEWKRDKWGRIGRLYYRFAEWLSTRISDAIVSDSPGIQDYYRDTYHTDSTYIPYGADISKSRKPALLADLGILPGGYFLQITRFEPENNPLLTIRAFHKAKTDKKLVLVGGIPYSSCYLKQIKAEADKNVLLPGFIFDKDLLNELWCNCYAYIHGNVVGGTNPALLQSMASSCFVLAADVDFNRYVLSDCGIYYDRSVDSLVEKMKWTLNNPEELEKFKMKAVQRIRVYYNWDAVAEQYESLFRSLISKQ